jgi:hypothetical protein
MPFLEEGRTRNGAESRVGMEDRPPKVPGLEGGAGEIGDPGAEGPADALEEEVHAAAEGDPETSGKEKAMSDVSTRIAALKTRNALSEADVATDEDLGWGDQVHLTIQHNELLKIQNATLLIIADILVTLVHVIDNRRT